MSKTPGVTAADVCRAFELSADAAKLLQPDGSARAFLDMLIASKLNQDAVRFTSHAMPKRDAIWWACQCARQSYGTAISAKAASALQAAEEWVAKQTDESRRTAFKAAEAAAFDNPAGLIGMAVFFSGGSLAPSGLADVLPEPHLASNAIANAVILSAVLGDPAQANVRYTKFFEIGFDVANGKNRWKGMPI